MPYSTGEEGPEVIGMKFASQDLQVRHCIYSSRTIFATTKGCLRKEPLHIAVLNIRKGWEANSMSEQTRVLTTNCISNSKGA
jgi:hypothetical protein